MTKLVLQIMGETDVLFESKYGKQHLKEKKSTIEGVQKEMKLLYEELSEDLGLIDFPLIRQMKEQQDNQEEVYYGIILTDQRPWLQAPQRELPKHDAKDYIASDGIWWKDILNAWCQKEEINWFPIHLQIHQEGEGEDNGVADWEKMARLVKETFQSLIKFQKKAIRVFPPEQEDGIDINKLIIQHSSGTPALSGALYLWGIEQKLAKQNVEFAYLAREDFTLFHSGNQWQWRFKAPQIKQLLDIQDFEGANNLLQDHFSEDLQNKVEELDRAVSFNLVNLPGVDQTAEGKVFERIAIALWSERAFREKKQWMHWYLRVAGAFELAIRFLVKKQAPNKYHWETIDPKHLNNNRNNQDQNEEQAQENQPSILIYTYNNNKRQFLLPISATVSKLLSSGNAYEKTIRGETIYHQIPPIRNRTWNQFKEFYCYQGWNLSNNFQTGFTEVRNQLYHLLQGDTIDQCLDQKTKDLGSTTHPEHPAQIAIQYLQYVNQLAEINKEVQDRVKQYQSRVREIKDNL